MESAAHVVAEPRRRGLLENLLVASLDRAVALSDGDDRAVPIGEHLYLDMAGPLEVALAEDGGVAEGRLGLASGGRKGVLELVRRTDDAHAATAAAGSRLDQKRKADLLRLALQQHRHTGLGCDALRRHLVASQAQRLRRRPDPGESRPLDGFGECSALGKEAVTGVHGVRLGLASGAHDLVGIQVRRHGNRTRRGSSVERPLVVGGRDGDRLDPEPVARAEDSGGDLAPVRDEQPCDAHGAIVKKP